MDNQRYCLGYDEDEDAWYLIEEGDESHFQSLLDDPTDADYDLFDKEYASCRINLSNLTFADPKEN